MPAEDSAKGRKLRLAKAGYHPGPIEDGEAQAPYLQAIKEFQRDHVKPPALPNPPERLKADGTIDGHTKTVLATLAPGRRPLFGDNARADLTADAAINTALNIHGAVDAGGTFTPAQIVGWVAIRKRPFQSRRRWQEPPAPRHARVRSASLRRSPIGSKAP